MFLMFDRVDLPMQKIYLFCLRFMVKIERLLRILTNCQKKEERDKGWWAVVEALVEVWSQLVRGVRIHYCDGSRKIFHHKIYPILTYVESTEDTIENNKAK